MVCKGKKGATTARRSRRVFHGGSRIRERDREPWTVDFRRPVFVKRFAAHTTKCARGKPCRRVGPGTSMSASSGPHTLLSGAAKRRARSKARTRSFRTMPAANGPHAHIWTSRPNPGWHFPGPRRKKALGEVAARGLVTNRQFGSRS